MVQFWLVISYILSHTYSIYRYQYTFLPAVGPVFQLEIWSGVFALPSWIASIEEMPQIFWSDSPILLLDLLVRPWFIKNAQCKCVIGLVFKVLWVYSLMVDNECCCFIFSQCRNIFFTSSKACGRFYWFTSSISESESMSKWAYQKVLAALILSLSKCYSSDSLANLLCLLCLLSWEEWVFFDDFGHCFLYEANLGIDVSKIFKLDTFQVTLIADGSCALPIRTTAFIFIVRIVPDYTRW